MTANERTVNSNVQRCPTTRAMTAPAPAVVRPSRLPSRCSNNRNTNLNNTSNSKPPPLNNNDNNNNRSLSVKKASKLPIRTTTSLTKQATPVKKSNVPTPVAVKTKKEPFVTSTRAVTSVSNTTTKKTIRPPTISKSSVAQNSSSKFRSRSITTVDNHHTNTSIPPAASNKRTRTTPPVVKKTPPTEPIKLVKPTEEQSSCTIEKMNSTSSESSIEENQQINKLLAVVQDEGYSTWSSSDVKDEIKSNNLKKNGTDEQRRRNTGMVKNWLDTSNKRCSRKPVKEGNSFESNREICYSRSNQISKYSSSKY
jgi:hypothetical protein